MKFELNRATLRVFLALTALTRLIYLFLKRETLARGGMEYEALADGFMMTGTISQEWNGQMMPSAFMPPGLVWILIIAKTISANHFHIILGGLHLAIATASLWILARIAVEIADRRVAFWACLFYLCDINLLIPTAWIYETIYTMFLMLIAAYLTLKATREPTIGRGALLGIVLGAASLFRSALLPQFVLTLAWMLWPRGIGDRGRMRMIVPITMTLLFLLTLAPWTIRNYRAFGKFIPVSHNLGINLWQGWNPESGGSAFRLDGSLPRMEPWLEERVASAPTEVEADAILARAAFEYARENPARWVRQRMLSLFFFWHEHNFWAPKSQFYTVPWRLLGFFNLFFVAIFFVSAIALARNPGGLRYILLVTMLNGVVHAFVHADIGSRYRYQIEPLMLLVIAIFVCRNTKMPELFHRNPKSAQP